MKEQAENIENKNPIIKDDEIDLIEVAKTIWAGRKLILKVTGVFLIIGLIIAFGSKVEYEASCKLMPESQEGMKSNLGGLGSLAGLAGINLDLGSGPSVLKPEIYPQVAESAPFLMKAWDKQLRFDKEDTIISSYRYFKEIFKPSLLGYVSKFTIGLPFQIKSWITDSDTQNVNQQGNEKLIRLSQKDLELIEMYRERINVEVDKKTGILIISVEMPDPMAAAELAQVCMDLLTEYITEYKISKAHQNFSFIQARYNEAKISFEKNQELLAAFNDRNRNVVTALGQAESQKLQNEYDVAYEVYKGLASQLEQAKIKVKEETPVFTVLEPVKVPTKKNKPKRLVILISAILVGLILGTSLQLSKEEINTIYQRLKSDS